MLGGRFALKAFVLPGQDPATQPRMQDLSYPIQHCLSFSGLHMPPGFCSSLQQVHTLAGPGIASLFLLQFEMLREHGHALSAPPSS